MAGDPARAGEPVGALIAAATLIPIRDTDHGLEVLMLRKGRGMAFGGMWVFPGGRIDPGDRTPPADEEIVARRAAVREAREEADLVVDPTDLVPFSHWTPPEESVHAPKRFATWFFLCRAPVGEAGVVAVDGGEIHEDLWARPAELLERRDAGEIGLVPPTAVTLHELRAHDTVDEALAAVAERDLERYVSRMGSTEEGLVTMWSGDDGYESGDATAAGARHRITMGDPTWTYERTV